MPTFNVLVAVVDLIDADSATDAINQLARRLTRAGYDTYDGDSAPVLPHAFLSDVDAEGNPQ